MSEDESSVDTTSAVSGVHDEHRQRDHNVASGDAFHFASDGNDAMTGEKKNDAAMNRARAISSRWLSEQARRGAAAPAPTSADASGPKAGDGEAARRPSGPSARGDGSGCDARPDHVSSRLDHGAGGAVHGTLRLVSPPSKSPPPRGQTNQDLVLSMHDAKYKSIMYEHFRKIPAASADGSVKDYWKYTVAFFIDLHSRLKKEGGRFLKKQGDCFVEVDDKEAKRFISNSIHCRMKCSHIWDDGNDLKSTERTKRSNLKERSSCKKKSQESNSDPRSLPLINSKLLLNQTSGDIVLSMQDKLYREVMYQHFRTMPLPHKGKPTTECHAALVFEQLKQLQKPGGRFLMKKNGCFMEVDEKQSRHLISRAMHRRTEIRHLWADSKLPESSKPNEGSSCSEEEESASDEEDESENELASDEHEKRIEACYRMSILAHLDNTRKQSGSRRTIAKYVQADMQRKRKGDGRSVENRRWHRKIFNSALKKMLNSGELSLDKFTYKLLATKEAAGKGCGRGKCAIRHCTTSSSPLLSQQKCLG